MSVDRAYGGLAHGPVPFVRWQTGAVSWIDRVVEQKVAEAIARDELVSPTMHGKALDLDTQRSDGWWADQFVKRERSRILRDDSLAQRATYPVRFWKAATVAELTDIVAEANRWIVSVNGRMVADDALELFNPRVVIDTWRTLPR